MVAPAAKFGVGTVVSECDHLVTGPVTAMLWQSVLRRIAARGIKTDA